MINDHEAREPIQWAINGLPIGLQRVTYIRSAKVFGSSSKGYGVSRGFPPVGQETLGTNV